jgi:hypothetical protein
VLAGAGHRGDTLGVTEWKRPPRALLGLSISPGGIRRRHVVTALLASVIASYFAINLVAGAWSACDNYNPRYGFFLVFDVLPAVAVLGGLISALALVTLRNRPALALGVAVLLAISAELVAGYALATSSAGAC